MYKCIHMYVCIHPSIKFTVNSSHVRLPFLAININLRDGYLHTDLHTKATNAHGFLHRRSCHPPHVYKNIPSNQFPRVRRHCSDLETFKNRSKEIEVSLLSRGCNIKSLKQASEKAVVTPRSETLTYKAKLGHKRPPMVVTHNPCNPRLKQWVAELQRDVINPNDRMRSVLPEPPLIAGRSYKSQKNHLMPHAPLDAVIGNFNCGRSKCLICQQHLLKTGNFKSERTGEVFTIRHKMTCDSSNIEYLLYCDTCSHTQYIGETKKQQQTNKKV